MDVRVTFYAQTGYNLSDEPASDTVIDMNDHWDMSRIIKEYDPGNRNNVDLKVELSDADSRRVDYIKLSINPLKT